MKLSKYILFLALFAWPLTAFGQGPPEGIIIDYSGNKITFQSVKISKANRARFTAYWLKVKGADDLANKPIKLRHQSGDFDLDSSKFIDTLGYKVFKGFYRWLGTKKFKLNKDTTYNMNLVYDNKSVGLELIIGDASSEDPTSFSLGKYDCTSLNDLIQKFKSANCKKEDSLVATLKNVNAAVKPYFSYNELASWPKKKVSYVLDFEPKGRYTQQFKKVWKEDTSIKIEEVAIQNERIGFKNINQFRVANVNKFRYNVAINDTLVRFDSEPNSLFNRLFLGDSSSINTLMKSVNGINFQTQSTKGGEPDTGNSLACFINTYNELQEIALSSLSRCANFMCCDAELKLYGELASLLTTLKAEIALKEGKQSIYEKELADAKTELTACDTLAAKQQKLAGLLKVKAAFDKLSPSEKKKKKPEIDANTAAIDAINKEIKGIKCSDRDKVEGDIERLTFELAVIEKLKELKKALPSKSDLTQLMLYLNSMTKGASEHVKTITDLDGNELGLDILIKVKDTIPSFDPSAKSDSFAFHFELPIVDRWFVSFSSGPFLGWGSDLRPLKYGFRPLPSPSNLIGTSPTAYEIVPTGRRELPLGLSAFMNLQYQVDRGFALGPSFGVGLSIQDNPQPAYLTGASLMFGHHRQIGVTFGLLFTKVKEFDNTRYVNVIYESPNININYNDVLRQGLFFSLSYTPFKEIKR